MSNENKTSTNEQNKANMQAIDQVVGETPAIKLLMSDISRFDEFQCRVKLESSAVEDYQNIYLNAAEGIENWTKKADKMVKAMDPLVVFEMEYKGKTHFILVSGWTRFEALKRAYKTLDPEREHAASDSAWVKCINGRTAEEAALYAIHCNSNFIGSRMRTDDYRKAVENIYRSNPSLSCRAIKDLVGGVVSHTTVNSIVKALKEKSQEVPEPEVKTTRSGKVVKATKAASKKQGCKQMNGEWVPEELEYIWKDTLIESFVFGIEAFVKALSADAKPHSYVPPSVVSDLQKIATALTDSLPGNVCKECGGVGCEHCHTHGFHPRRECYGETEKPKTPKPRKRHPELTADEPVVTTISERDEFASEFNAD